MGIGPSAQFVYAGRDAPSKQIPLRRNLPNPCTCPNALLILLLYMSKIFLQSVNSTYLPSSGWEKLPLGFPLNLSPLIFNLWPLVLDSTTLGGGKTNPAFTLFPSILCTSIYAPFSCFVLIGIKSYTVHLLMVQAAKSWQQSSPSVKILTVYDIIFVICKQTSHAMYMFI